MLLGSRAFVFVVYLVLGFAFLAETAILAHEYRDAGWFSFATMDSHLFIFFPTFGLVALAAFYLPSCAFVDLYWRHIRLGKLRFLLGLAVVAALAYGLAQLLLSTPYRNIWEIAPQTLLQDRGEPDGCGSGQRPCERVGLLDAVNSVRTASQTRIGVREFVRVCGSDALLEPQGGVERRRFCFAATPMSPKPPLLTDAECCRAQARLLEAINRLSQPADQRSVTSTAHAVIVPLKVFFLLILLAISILLAFRHESLAKHYRDRLERIELGVLVGTIVMLFFPLMSQAFEHTSSALYGTTQSGGFRPMIPMISFAFGAWALLILFFFYRRRDKQVEMVGKLAGVMASAVAVVKYDLLIAILTRIMGSGATALTIGALALAALIAVLVLLVPLWRERRHGRKAAQTPPSATPLRADESVPRF